jgi:hypothetical protein
MKGSAQKAKGIISFTNNDNTHQHLKPPSPATHAQHAAQCCAFMLPRPLPNLLLCCLLLLWLALGAQLPAAAVCQVTLHTSAPS